MPPSTRRVRRSCSMPSARMKHTKNNALRTQLVHWPHTPAHSQPHCVTYSTTTSVLCLFVGGCPLPQILRLRLRVGGEPHNRCPGPLHACAGQKGGASRA